MNRILFIFVWGFLGKSKAKPWELMLKVDNIIPLWRSVISNMVSEPYPKLSHANRILTCRTKGVLCLNTQKMSRASIKGSLFECSIGFRRGSIAYLVRGDFVRRLQNRSRASTKGSLFDGSIGLRKGSITYIVRRKDCW